MGRVRWKLVSLTVCAGTLVLTAPSRARADDQSADSPPPRVQRARKKAATPPSAEPLSEEDAALVRELALLERVDMLRNFELFEPAKRPEAQSKKGSP